jgi:diguanylate cyclase (GGDEF)-like protein
VAEPDHVTGLQPRGALEAFFSGKRDAAAGLALLMCDVVRLKEINERDGFAAGDACLRRAAERLRAAAADADILARLGGDELVAVFTGPSASVAADHAATTLVGGSAPPLRAAAIVQKPGETYREIIDRLYAIVRRS